MMLLHDVGVDHCGFQVFVPEQFLHGADVSALFQQVGGEAVAQCVALNVLVDPGSIGCAGKGFGEIALVDVVPSPNFRVWTLADIAARE